MNSITLNDLLIKLEEYNKEEVEVVRKTYIYANDIIWSERGLVRYFTYKFSKNKNKRIQ